MFGGVGTVWGPVIGSVILIPLAETLNAERAPAFPAFRASIYGLAIICVILLAPEGLFWKVRDFMQALGAAGCRNTGEPDLPTAARRFRGTCHCGPSDRRAPAMSSSKSATCRGPLAD